MRTKRVVILHYTASPRIGGVEALIELQRVELTRRGLAVRLIVGEGGDDGQVVRLPLLQPSHPRVMTARAALAGSFPHLDHPLVTEICGQLQTALRDCHQCWVHNVLTMYVNPFLTSALVRLIQEMPGLRWVAWCEDISATSAHWPTLTPEEREMVTPPPDVTYIAISRARRVELAKFLELPAEDIKLIPPPLDVDGWLSLGEEACAISRRLNELEAEPVILVPAKLLPHKNLDLAVRVAAALPSTVRPAVLFSAVPSPHQPDISEAVRDRLLRLAQELGVAESLHLLTDVLGKAPARQTIRDLMLLSDLVFLPSTEEGFGMPLLEVAALRVPIICSNIPAFRDAGGSSAQYFSLDADPASIATQIMEIARSPLNQQRRYALRSAMHFSAQLDELLAGLNPPLPLRERGRG